MGGGGDFCTIFGLYAMCLVRVGTSCLGIVHVAASYGRHPECEIPPIYLSRRQQQQQSHRLRTDSNQSHGGGGLNAFYWSQIFSLDSGDVQAQKT